MNIYRLCLELANERREKQRRALTARRLARHAAFMAPRLRIVWSRQPGGLAPIDATR